MSVPVPITAAFESTPGTPLVAPGVVPTIRIRRNDTGALEVTDVAMTEIGDGNFFFSFAPAVDGVSYSARADGDPTGITQVPAASRYSYGEVDNRLEEMWTRDDLILPSSRPMRMTARSLATANSRSLRLTTVTARLMS